MVLSIAVARFFFSTVLQTAALQRAESDARNLERAAAKKAAAQKIFEANGLGDDISVEIYPTRGRYALGLRGSFPSDQLSLYQATLNTIREKVGIKRFFVIENISFGKVHLKPIEFGDLYFRLAFLDYSV